MPRSAAKSRADNQSRRSVQAITPPTEELEAADIIPVVLTHSQWTHILTQEDSDEAVGEIMEEVLSKVTEGCFKAYIKRQVKLKRQKDFYLYFPVNSDPLVDTH